ncbi:hypothetical protein Tco_0193735 [Tanacetum coccineum]
MVYYRVFLGTQEELFVMRKKGKLEHTANGCSKDHLRRFHGYGCAKRDLVQPSRHGKLRGKGYDRFQKLLSQLDALGAGVSDGRRKSQCLEQDIQKKTSSSSLTSDNVAFLSQAKASSSKHKPSHSSGSYSSYTTSSSKATTTATPGLADEVIHSFLATNADDVLYDYIKDLDQLMIGIWKK